MAALRVPRGLFAEAPNGINTVFTTTFKWQRTATDVEQVYHNGLLNDEDDYTPSESTPATGFDTVTFLVAPVTGDKLVISYTPIP